MKNKIFAGILIEAFGFLISIGRNIIIIPVLLATWGKYQYGLFISVLVFIDLIKVFDAGYQNYVRNDFSIAYHTDKALAKRIIASNFKISYIIGLFEITLFAVLSKLDVLPSIIGMSEENFNENQVGLSIFVILLSWVLLGCVSGILHKIVFPINYARSAVYGIITKIFEIFVLLLVCYYKLSFLYICLSLSLTMLITTTCYLIDIKNVAPEFFPWWKGGDIRLGLKYFWKSIPLTLNNFTEQFSNNNIISLISRYISLETVPVFTTNRTVTNVLLQVSNLFVNPLNPEISRYHAINEKLKIIRIVQLNWLISNLIIAFPLILFASYFDPLYEYWVKGKLNFTPTLFYLLALGVYINAIGKFYVVYLTIINNTQSLNIISFLRMIIVVGLAYILTPIYQLTGLGIAILVGELVCSFILPFYFFYKKTVKELRNPFNLSFFLASASLILLSCFFICYSLWVSTSTILLFSLLLGGIVFFQYRISSIEIKNIVFLYDKRKKI